MDEWCEIEEKPQAVWLMGIGEDGVVLSIVMSTGSSMMSKKAAEKTMIAVIPTANHELR
jgi:hypothetical protein